MRLKDSIRLLTGVDTDADMTAAYVSYRASKNIDALKVAALKAVGKDDEVIKVYVNGTDEVEVTRAKGLKMISTGEATADRDETTAEIDEAVEPSNEAEWSEWSEWEVNDEGDVEESPADEA